jgi:hypothetical protein
MEMVGAVNGVLGINYWNWNGGGSPSEFTDLSNLVAGQANQVLALTRRDPNIMNITAARPFARRRRNAGVQRGTGDLQLIGVRRLHTGLIHKQDKRSSCG